MEYKFSMFKRPKLVELLRDFDFSNRIVKIEICDEGVATPKFSFAYNELTDVDFKLNSRKLVVRSIFVSDERDVVITCS